MNKAGKILLVEDDQNFGMVLKNYLEISKLDIRWERNGKAGLERFRNEDFDLCILDVMMPEMDGFTLAEQIRNLDKRTPILFLTARSQKEDIIKGYERGAQDYLAKPFDPEILLLKIKVMLDREIPTMGIPETEYQFLDYELQVSLRRLQKNGTLFCELSPRETAVLAMLLEKRNDLVMREEILRSVWKENTYFTARSMDVYINKIRKKFENDPALNINNIRGEGFILEIQEPVA